MVAKSIHDFPPATSGNAYSAAMKREYVTTVKGGFKTAVTQYLRVRKRLRWVVMTQIVVDGWNLSGRNGP